MRNSLYGNGAQTFEAAGGELGIRKLVDSFYDIMEANEAYHRIFSWHPSDQEMTRDKLAVFLFAWTGGPRLYQQKYGAIRIPQAHAHLKVTEVERDMWLNCMQEALAEQDYPKSLKDYLLEALAIPAERIRQVSVQRHQS